MWGNNGNRLNNNNQSNGLNVNTRIKTFTSDVSSLATSFWNQSFSITISPAIGADGNGVMQYDQNRQGKTALTMEACAALVEKFEEVIKPVYEAVVLRGEPCPESLSATIETGREPKRNIIGFEMTSPTDGEVPDLYFVFYGTVDANNIASPANTFKHKFAKRSVKIDYNPVTGLYSKETQANADFDLFVNMISKTELMLPFSEHIKKYNAEKSKNYQSGNSNSNSYTGGNNSYSGNPGATSVNFASSSPAYSGNTYGAGMFGALAGSEEIPFN